MPWKHGARIYIEGFRKRTVRGACKQRHNLVMEGQLQYLMIAVAYYEDQTQPHVKESEQAKGYIMHGWIFVDNKDMRRY